MYRQPLLFPEDVEPLIGKVARLEFSPYSQRDYVGTVTGLAAGYRAGDNIAFTRSDGSRDELLFIGGTNVVFATTLDSFIPPDREAPFEPVLWREREVLQLSPPSP